MRGRKTAVFLGLTLGLALLHPASVKAVSGLQPGLRWEWGIYKQALSYSSDYQGTIQVDSPAGGAEIAMLKVGEITRVTIPRDGGRTTIIRKGDRVALKGLPVHGWWKLLGQDLPLDEELLGHNYTIKAEPARWEEREVWKIELTPRYPGNPSRVVMVDRTWLLPLYLEDHSPDGRILQTRKFRNLTVPPRVSSREIEELEKLVREEGRKVSAGPPPIISARDAAEELGFEPVLPGYVPEGYRLLGVRISRRERGLAHILFYNGVGVISLFEQKIPWWARSSSPPSAGTAIAWEARGIRRTLVGDVPEKELLKMARSFID